MAVNKQATLTLLFESEADRDEFIGGLLDGWGEGEVHLVDNGENEFHVELLGDRWDEEKMEWVPRE